tara:strand:- start:311 stop:1624 length:1314 start_codon:yes stop_codon:yes gene_type:complete
MVKLRKKNKLWFEAIKVIPGGNGLLSKRPERFLPEYWPTYYKKCKGIKVTDLDNRSYLDFSNMAVGSCILGYSNSEVNNFVKKNIDVGNNCTLNSPLEVQLAKKIISLHPEFQKVKFAKTGGEAIAMAIRISRAFTNSASVAFSGYHGWHDWYLATNLNSNKNLNEHLLPGLSPLGVPKKLISTALPVKFNDVNDLNKIFSKKNYPKILIVEGARFNKMDKNFANKINEIKINKDIILIIDEITSGWRSRNGGVYKFSKLNPDIVVYGKSIGNGYPISILVGKGKVMDYAQDTFISSSLWTESTGFAAAIKTIDIFKSKNVSKFLYKQGMYIEKKWYEIARKTNINIVTNNFKPLITFKFKDFKDSDLISTYFTQEMLKEGFLATNSIYLSYAHKTNLINQYLKSFEKVFKKISKNKNEIKKNLLSSKKTADFKRLT